METDLNSIFGETPPSPAGQAPASNPPSAKEPKKKRTRKGKAAAPTNGMGKRRGARRTPVAAQAQAVPAAAANPPATGKKRGRKPRQPGSPAASGLKLDLTTMMGALVGLKAQDAALVGKITQALQTVNKKSRQRVLEAVGRLFA